LPGTTWYGWPAIEDVALIRLGVGVAFVGDVADEEGEVESAFGLLHLVDDFLEEMAAVGVDVVKIVDDDEGEIVGRGLGGEEAAGPQAGGEEGGGRGLKQAAAGQHGKPSKNPNDEIRKKSQ
jgi:hypothetical protein